MHDKCVYDYLWSLLLKFTKWIENDKDMKYAPSYQRISSNNRIILENWKEMTLNQSLELGKILYSFISMLLTLLSFELFQTHLETFNKLSTLTTGALNVK